ncbi:MAG: lysophospholipid acyltransferase family protein, partial [Cryomorphaceae bacterium]
MQIVVFLLRILSLLPLGVLYRISDVLAWSLQHVFGYRKGVVHLNLRKSFPDKTSSERSRITNEFYAYLADVMVETIKLQSISAEGLKKRVVFLQPELLSQKASQGKNVILLMGHSGNWEWAGCAASLYYDLNILPVYRKVKQVDMDRYFFRLRSRFGSMPILDKEAFLTIKDQPAPHAVALLADHTPGAEKGLWIEFLSQQAPFYRGTEVLLKRLDYEVVFAHVRRVKRGKYEIHLEEFHPSHAESHEVTKAFVAVLEREIHARP